MLHVALSAHTLHHTHMHTPCIDLKKRGPIAEAMQCVRGGQETPAETVGVSACQHKWVREIDELVRRERGHLNRVKRKKEKRKKRSVIDAAGPV